MSAQLNRVQSSFPIAAAKTGMLATAGNVRAVIEWRAGSTSIPLVVDPIISASAGSPLLDDHGLTLLRSELLARSTLVTPNLPETATLLDETDPAKLKPDQAALALFERYGCSVLVKGGHATDTEVLVDWACLDGELQGFPHPRLDVPDVHGTGCTLSAAIASQLALGESLTDAIAKGIHYFTATLTKHFHWPESGGSESLNHFPDTLD